MESAIIFYEVKISQKINCSYFTTQCIEVNSDVQRFEIAMNDFLAT
jgi:hypothetical protein